MFSPKQKMGTNLLPIMWDYNIFLVYLLTSIKANHKMKGGVNIIYIIRCHRVGVTGEGRGGGGGGTEGLKLWILYAPRSPPLS